MEVFNWLAANGLDLGVVIGLMFTAYAVHEEAKQRKIGNLIALGQSHQSLSKRADDPALSRIWDERADLGTNPLTNAERVHVAERVIHLNIVHHAIKAGMFVGMEGFTKDVRAFFSRPIPKAAWEKLKPFQDERLVSFVKDCLKIP